ncbi:MAG: hypothetical protein N2560_00515 [Ignavibacteria bacterium]|nr:hypothetical protein [Ignavibacteria bacterium]
MLYYKRKNYLFIVPFLLFIFNSVEIYSQQQNGEITFSQFDTNIVFTSPRPLLSSHLKEIKKSDYWGLNLVLSNNGFGFGAFYELFFTKQTYLFVNLYLSGARNTDEFEYYNPWTGQLFIPGKVNRLYMFPLTFGIVQSFLTDVLGTNFTPYVNFGMGPTFIVSTPYEKEFFTSLGYARFYIRFGLFVGTGVNIPITDKSYIGVSARQYWIPFGGNGLESIKDKPIKDFGGFFLALNFGIKI